MAKEKIETKSDCYYYNWGGDIRKGFTCYPREYGARCEFVRSFFGYRGLSCRECGEFIKDDGKRIKPSYFYQFSIGNNPRNSETHEILDIDSDEKAIFKAKKKFKKRIKKPTKQKMGLKVFKLIHEEEA